MTTPDPNSALPEQLLASQLDRRDLMKRALAVSLSTPAVIGLLAACGSDDEDEPEAEPTEADSTGADPTAADSDATEADAEATEEGEPEATAADGDATAEEPEGDATPPAEGASGGTLRLIDGTEPNSLDPPIGTGPFGHQIRALFEPLLGMSEELEPQPLLATSWEVDEAGSTWTLTLKEGVKFHDGTDFDSESVKFALERLLDPEFAAGRRALFLVIQSVIADDPFTVQIETEGTFPDLPFLLADASASMVSPTAAEEFGPDDFGLNPVGTGPFKFVEWVPNDHVTMERFEDYHDGPINLEGMVFRPVPEASSREAMLRAGEADIVFSPPIESIPSLEEEEGLEVLILDTLSQVTSEMRQTQPPFNNKQVRQAMNYAIDKQAIVDTIMGGLGAVVDSPALPGIWAYEAQEPYTYDPERAQELLAEGGYPDGFDGNLFYVSGRWAGDDQVTEAMQAYWSAVGVNIQVNRIDSGSLGDYLRRDPDEMAGWTTQQIRSSAYQDYHLYRLFHSESTFDDAAQRSGYLNEEVDDLINQARATFDEAEREDLYKQVQRLVWDDAAFVWLFVQQDVMCHRTGVSGFQILRNGVTLLNDVVLPG